MSAEASSARKRALIECFKFLSASEILRTSCTCRCWHSLCESDELWLFLLGEEGNQYRQTLTPVPNLQEAFRLLQKFVYVIRGNNLLRFAASSGEWVSKPLSISGHLGTELVLTRASKSKLLACGGSSPTPDAFFIDTLTAITTVVQSMPVHRPYPGVCCYDLHVYCFAGDFANRRKDCDRINTNTGVWEKLPDCLMERHAFNPVVVRPVIYLPNGCTPTVEAFDVPSATFSMLWVDTSQINSSGNLYYNGELVILGLGKAFAWKPGDAEGRSIKYSTEMTTAWSSFDPVIHAGEVVLAWSYGSRWKIGFVHLTTFQHRTVGIPEY